MGNFHVIFHLLRLTSCSETQEGVISVMQYTMQALSNGEIARESSSTAYLSSGIPFTALFCLHDLLVDILHLYYGNGYGVNGRQLWVSFNLISRSLRGVV
jgi:hypothetical protein